MSERIDYDFTSAETLLEICTTECIPIYEVMIRREMYRTEMPREAIIEEMRKNLMIMRDSVDMGINEQQSSVSGLTGGDAIRMQRYGAHSYMGAGMCNLVAAALGVVEVNSSMGKIVAAPTAGSAGVIPACIFTASNRFGFSDEVLINGLFTAAAVGNIIAEKATLAGSEGGCQAEVGSASAMGAAALCEMRGGLPKHSLDAAAMAIKMILGLVCDPIGGLVECPCIKRNAMGAVNAVLAADMALAGIKSIIPFDEVVMAMRSVGRQMNPDLRETARGGLAATPTGKEIMRMLRGEKG